MGAAAWHRGTWAVLEEGLALAALVLQQATVIMQVTRTTKHVSFVFRISCLMFHSHVLLGLLFALVYGKESEPV